MITGGPAELGTLARQLREEARGVGQRRAVILAGAAEWGRQQAVAMLDAAGLERGQVLWAGEAAPEGSIACAPDGLLAHLGTESDALVVDAHAGLDPDGLGAGVGTVRGGGLVMLLTPPLEEWPAYADPQADRLVVDGYGAEALTGRFLAWLAATFRADPWTVVLEQGHTCPEVQPLPGSSAEPSTPDDPDCITADQATAVAAVLRTATGHRRRPTVLTADRGRGKSAALGIAAGRLLRDRGGLIVVTGPRRGAVEPVLSHAARVLGVASGRTEVVAPDGARLRFLLPGEIAASEETPALVLVDEAAALPADTLGRLLQQHSRIVFATTVHGYEGSGRGFALRFQDVLDASSPRRQYVTLNAPVRWQSRDPVEALVFRALVLDADLPALGEETATEVPRVERVERDRLLTEPELLRALFGLLVHAHYRTRPLDLRNLLDGPNLNLYLLWQAQDLVGTALVAAEGGFDAITSRAIWAGERRPQGHLLPQSLAAHVGLPNGARARVARIMRIAVHPRRQGRGLGSALVDVVARDAATAGLDMVGASFGATPDLLRFWERCGCRPLRLGVRRDAASGTHSAVVARSLGDGGDQLLEQGRARMARDLPGQLADALAVVEPDLVLPLLATLDVPEPDAEDWLDVVGFATGQRAFEVSLTGLHRVVLRALSRSEVRTHLERHEQTALVARVLQRRPWAESARLAGECGRPGLVQVMRRGLARLIPAHAPAAARGVIPDR